MKYRNFVSALALVIVTSLGFSAPAQASVDDFTISRYDVQMRLGRDSEGRSTLKTTEIITAQFPDFDQNHGIERIFVREYDGHSTSFNLESVTDQNNTPLDYNWNEDALRIGSKNSYVHGEQTYKITYSQRDVTKHYGDVNSDEFYWDTIGIEWRQPIASATVSFTYDETLQDNLSSNYSCYYGSLNSTNQCLITHDPTAKTFTATANNLAPRQGVSIAIGFKPQTFSAYQPSLLERLGAIWSAITIVTVPIVVGILAWMIFRFYRQIDRKKELGTIIPEYLPLRDTSILAAATATRRYGTLTTANLLDLAVRHYIKIYEVKQKSFLSPAQYEIEVTKDISTLKAEERELIEDMFGSTPVVGKKLNLKKLQNNTGYYSRTLNNDKDLRNLIRGDYALRVEDDLLKKSLRHTSKVLLVISVLLLNIPFLFASLVVFAYSFAAWKLTDKGLDIARYLKGLEMYIKTAEKDRLAMLQSPEGAEKVKSIVKDATSESQLVKLYERLLPYAVLFRQEKEWNKQLGRYYETTGEQPTWYSGHGAFTAASFASAMSSFSTSAPSASSSSSSSGGSTGGGFAGGGGGGGGGGGW